MIANAAYTSARTDAIQCTIQMSLSIEALLYNVIWYGFTYILPGHCTGTGTIFPRLRYCWNFFVLMYGLLLASFISYLYPAGLQRTNPEYYG